MHIDGMKGTCIPRKMFSTLPILVLSLMGVLPHFSHAKEPQFRKGPAELWEIGQKKGCHLRNCSLLGCHARPQTAFDFVRPRLKTYLSRIFDMFELHTRMRLTRSYKCEEISRYRYPRTLLLLLAAIFLPKQTRSAGASRHDSHKMNIIESLSQYHSIS